MESLLNRKIGKKNSKQREIFRIINDTTVRLPIPFNYGYRWKNGDKISLFAYIRLQYQFKQTLLNYAIVEGNISSHKNRNSGNQEFLIHPFFSLAKGTIKKKSKFAKRKPYPSIK